MPVIHAGPDADPRTLRTGIGEAGGEPVEIRRLAPGERAPIEGLLEGLSPASRRFRFLGPVPRITGSLVRALAAVDGDDHVALIAFAGGRPVGEARYVRLPADPAAADFAIAVVDDHHRRGVARALAAALAVEARRAGVRRFVFDASPENRPVLAFLAGMGATTRLSSGLVSGWLDVEAVADAGAGAHEPGATAAVAA